VFQTVFLIDNLVVLLPGRGEVSGYYTVLAGLSRRF